MQILTTDKSPLIILTKKQWLGETTEGHHTADPTENAHTEVAIDETTDDNRTNLSASGNQASANLTQVTENHSTANASDATDGSKPTTTTMVQLQNAAGKLGNRTTTAR